MAAERLLEEAITREPDSHEARVALVNARLRRADFAGAEEVLEEALALRPEAPDLLTLRAGVRAKLGQLEEAAADLAAALASAPSRNRALHLGHLRHAMGRPERAVPLFHRALALGAADDGGQRAQVWTMMTRALRDLGRGLASDDAAEACWRLYRQRPDWVAASIERATNQFDFWEWDGIRKKDDLACVLAGAGPDAAPPHPPTYRLPEETERLAEDAAGWKSGPVWIVKPCDLFGGQGIRLVDDPDAMPRDKPALVQHYVDRPLLVDGHKQHLRLYVMITEAEPLRAWLWRDGLVRFAPAPFEKGPGWLERADMHITSTVLHEGHPGIRFNANGAVENDGSIWGLAAFVARVAGDAAVRGLLWERLEDLARRLVRTIAGTGLLARQSAGGRAYRPKLIGLDVLLDADLRPWLIDLQRNPPQLGRGPVNRVNARLFRNMFEMTLPLVRGTGAEAIRAAERSAEEDRRGAFVPL